MNKRRTAYLDSLPADAVAIPGYLNAFATPDGRIITKFGRLKQRAFGVNSCGYPICGLKDSEGVLRWPMVHRIIAKLFVEGDNNLTVNHIDMIKSNCSASNLEWVTFSENHTKGRKLKPEWGKDGLAKRAVFSRDPRTGQEIRHESGKAAALWVGRADAAGNISKAIRHGREAYGFTWRKA